MKRKTQSTTRHRILAVTGKLFSERGYFGVSMQDIAAELGISKAALYYHFTSKDALAELLLRNSLNELKIELKNAVKSSTLPSDVVFTIVKTLLDFKIHHPEISLLASLGAGDDERSPILATVIEVRQELFKFIRTLVGGLDFSRRITYRAIAVVVSSMISLTLSPFLLETKQSSREKAEDISRLLLSGTGRNSA